MVNSGDKLITYALKPLSFIYRAVTDLRNLLYDKGVLKTHEFRIPVICVGNLSVGGTGKTPLVEYIVSRLMGKCHIGIVSRGYKRHTKGFVLANSKSSPETIGDEPYQMHSKFGKQVRVAVCEDRVKGIRKLAELDRKIDLIILDDAFQHRKVRPDISIMLMDYNKPVYEDDVLPLGTLREHRAGMNRADIVMVTKCPSGLQPLDYGMFNKCLELMKYQQLFFSKIKYDELKNVFPEENIYSADLSSLNNSDTVLLVTGIANPRSLIRYCSRFNFRLRIMHFPDHHNFTKSDFDKIKSKFKSLKGNRKIILTTEKDASRMLFNPYFPYELRKFCFYQPIRVDMIGEWPKNTTFDIELEKLLAKVQRKKNPESKES